MAICDRGGLPIAVHVASASPYEPHLVPATLDARFLPDLPWCLIGDRGYDSDGLDDLLMTQYGIEMIAANRRGRAKTQDGRPLRRAKRRWKIERLFAWLHNCRRVVTRWERHVGNYLGMVQLACARILLRAFMRWLLVLPLCVICVHLRRRVSAPSAFICGAVYLRHLRSSAAGVICALSGHLRPCRVSAIA